MNELTKAATNTEKAPGGLAGWPVLGLLGVLSVSSVGGYGQLSALNEQIAENNRLAEARGATAAQVDTLRGEVEKLRAKVGEMQSIDDARDDFRIMKDAVTQLSARIDQKAELTTVLDHVQTARARVEALAEVVDKAVTQDQFDVLIGRVDAISRRVLSPEGDSL